MKKRLSILFGLILFALPLFTLLGCESEDEIIKLSGTYWKYLYPSTHILDYSLLHFTSDSRVDIIEKRRNEPPAKRGEGRYVIKGQRITIDAGDVKFVGTIEYDEMRLMRGRDQFIFIRDR